MKIQNILFTCLIFFIILFSSCKKNKLPIADFSFDNYQELLTDINFINNSQNADRYIWYFGDGQASNQVNPTYSYYKPGTYTVELQAYNDYGYVSCVKKLTVTGTTYSIINYCEKPIMDFFTFYEINNGYIYDYYNLGHLEYGEESAFIITDRDQVRVGYRESDGKIFVITNPFLVYKDHNNVYKIHDYMTGTYIEK